MKDDIFQCRLTAAQNGHRPCGVGWCYCTDYDYLDRGLGHMVADAATVLLSTWVKSLGVSLVLAGHVRFLQVCLGTPKTLLALRIIQLYGIWHTQSTIWYVACVCYVRMYNGA
jgi:hypothetical protein